MFEAWLFFFSTARRYTKRRESEAFRRSLLLFDREIPKNTDKKLTARFTQKTNTSSSKKKNRLSLSPPPSFSLPLSLPPLSLIILLLLSALNPTLDWSSSAPSVISVDPSTGVVTAGASQGTANIIATAVDGSIASAAQVMYVGVITISPSNPTVYTAAPVQLTPSIYPPSAVISWTTSNPALATVSGTGLVTAVDNGSGTVITLFTADGRSAGVTVTTVVSVASVSIVQPR